MDDDGIVTDEIVSWITSVTNAEDLHIERRSAGGSRAGYAVDVRREDGSESQLWLRIDAITEGVASYNFTEFTLHKEAAVYRALQQTEVRVPEFIAVHPELQAFLTRRIEGRNWFAEITDPRQQEAVASDFITQIVELHRIDPLSLDLPELGKPGSLSDHVMAEIDLWERLHLAGVAIPEPVVLVALAWLRSHFPADPGYGPVFVQGDTGPGNFMYDDKGVVAVVDWENAHFGDFHDDLAWLYVRDLQERFTSLPIRLAQYEELSGRSIDLERLRYFVVLAQMRGAIGTLNAIESQNVQSEMANNLIYGALHVRMLAEALANASGIDFDDSGEGQFSAVPATGVTWLYDIALDDLRNVVVPNLPTGGFAHRRGKGLARIVKMLREQDRIGPAIERAEFSDLETLLGERPESVALGRKKLGELIVNGRVSDVAGIEYSLRYVSRRTELMRGAMGALADRHFSPIEIAT
jgi:aminoglycoside phosphotransferase (APT) family kinase protein